MSITVGAKAPPIGFAGDDAGKVAFRDTFWIDGGALTVEAGKVEVMPGAVVSTRDVASSSDLLAGASTSDSGALSLSSLEIGVGLGASVLSQVEDGSSFQAGALSLLANDNDASLLSLLPFFDGTNVSTSIVLTGANIKGGAVTIAADANAADQFTDDDEESGFGSTFGEAATDFFSEISLVGGVAISRATADVDIDGGVIEGDSVTITADADTDASVLTITLVLGVAYAKTVPHATIDVTGDALIDSAGAVTVQTSATSTAQASAQQSLTGISTASEKYNLTLSILESDIQSTALVGAGAMIDAGGALSVDTRVDKDHTSGSSSLAYDDGTLAGALTINIDNTISEAKLDGDATVGQGVLVRSVIDTFDNGADAAAGVGTSSGRVEKYVKGPLGRAASRKLYDNAFGKALSKIGVRGRHETQNTTNKQKFGLSAAFSYAEFNNTSLARIGDNAVVNAGGDLTVYSEVNESPANSATSKLQSNRRKEPTKTSQVNSQREYAVSGAVMVGIFTNTVDAYIGEGAQVMGENITVEAKAATPRVIRYFVNEDLLDFQTYVGKLKGDLGVPSGFFTTNTSSKATGEKAAISGSLTFVKQDNTARARIAKNARVTARQDLRAMATEEINTLNWSGPFVKNVIQVDNLFKSTGTEGFGVGGSYAWMEYGATTQAEIDEGAIVDADAVLVYADSDTRNVTIGVNGGAADKLAVNGVLSAIVISNNTLARIDEDAVVTTGGGSVKIPIDYDTITDGDESPFTSVPQFDPLGVDANGEAAVDSVANTITFNAAHGLTTGDALVYDDGGGVAIGGLTDGETYFAVVVDGTTLQLVSTFANALAPTPVPIGLSLTSTAGDAHSLYKGFAPTLPGVVDTVAGTIDINFRHDLAPGQPVFYSLGGGAPIGGPATTRSPLATGCWVSMESSADWRSMADSGRTGW